MKNQVTQSIETAIAATYALAILTHTAHWNIRAPAFFSLHAAFGEQYEELIDAADTLAERLRALGEFALPSLAPLINALAATKPPVEAEDYVGAVAVDNRKVLEYLQSLKEAATKAGDLETQNMAIERITRHQKVIWMLEAASSL